MSTSYWISLTGQATANLGDHWDEVELKNNGYIRVGFLRWLVWTLSLPKVQSYVSEKCPACPYHSTDHPPFPGGADTEGIGIIEVDLCGLAGKPVDGSI
jgi:hypothetical protein